MRERFLNMKDNGVMSKAEKKAQLEKEAMIDRKEVYQAKLFKVVHDHIQYRDYQTKTYDLILHPGAVALIPIDKNENLLFVKQWRRAANRIMIELPAGTLEKGETPIDCADRELREETGYKANEITPLGGFYSAPGICSEYLYLFFAKSLTLDPLIGDDTDEIDLLKVPLKQVLKMVQKGEIIDAKTVAGVLWYNQWLKQ